jgi:phosphinothricin acetyltransferase
VNDAPALAPVTLRDCGYADIAAVTAIYGHYVRTSLATFEEIAPTAAEIAQRHGALRDAGLPYLVAADPHGAILGFAYAASYRPRSAYRFTVEDSIYVAPGFIHRGIGRALLASLVQSCVAAGYRQMVAVIGDSANVASIGLHEKMGFKRVGLQPAIGFKLGRWVDGVIMQRALGAGSTTLPI